MTRLRDVEVACRIGVRRFSGGRFQPADIVSSQSHMTVLRNTGGLVQHLRFGRAGKGRFGGGPGHGGYFEPAGIVLCWRIER